MDKRNRPALGFLLAGVGLAGRALMGVPQASSIAELTLGALMLIGYLVLVQQVRLPVFFCAASLALELYLCGTGLDTAALSTVLLRQADLWFAYDAATLTLRCAKTLCPELYGRRSGTVPVVALVLLAVQSLAQLGAALLPQYPALPMAGMALFVAFSVVMLGYTLLFIRAYNALRIKKENRRQL